MGCVMHFVLSDGKHPFGADEDERNLNIKNDKYELTLDPNQGKTSVPPLQNFSHA